MESQDSFDAPFCISPSFDIQIYCVLGDTNLPIANRIKEIEP